MTTETPNPAPKRPFRFALGLVVVVVLLAIGGVLVFSRSDPMRAEVLRIMSATNSQATASRDAALVALGPKAMPALARLLGYRESKYHAAYRKKWPTFPAALRKLLPNPEPYLRAHDTAMIITYSLGPAYTRPLTSAIVRGRFDDTLGRSVSVASLYWSVPGSDAARKRLIELVADPTNELATPPTNFWSTMPETAPYFIARLHVWNQVSSAAAVLASMGSNATAAIPALIEVCDKGVASPPINMPSPPAVKPGAVPIGWYVYNAGLLGARTNALYALRKIGVASPEVLAAVNRMFSDTNEGGRFAALITLHELHQPLNPALTNTLMGFQLRSTRAFQEYIKWVGTLGSEGRDALPWLKQFTSLEFDNSLQAGDSGPLATTGRTPPVAAVLRRQVEDLRQLAIIAICRIDPDQIPAFVPDLANALSTRPETAEILAAAKSAAPQILDVLKPMLNPGDNRSAVAAYVVLRLAPDNADAAQALSNRIANGALQDRITASYWSWKLSGDPAQFITLAGEGLRGGPNTTGLAAIRLLNELGPAARQAVPALQIGLTNTNVSIRRQSGDMLLRIAPEVLPPVH